MYFQFSASFSTSTAKLIFAGIYRCSSTYIIIIGNFFYERVKLRLHDTFAQGAMHAMETIDKKLDL